MCHKVTIILVHPAPYMESKLEARAVLKAERSGWLRRLEVVSLLSREFLYLETNSLKRKFGKICSAESRVKLHLGHLEIARMKCIL